MPRKFILDTEVNLNKTDHLKNKKYAENLISSIHSIDTSHTFNIGLFGVWGAGKSSIITTAKEGLESANIKVITYDAWKYANDSFRRTFLLKVYAELNPNKKKISNILYTNASKEVSAKYAISFIRLFLTLGCILAAWWAARYFEFIIREEINLLIYLGAVGWLVATVSNVFNVYKASITTPYLFSPEQFESVFQEIIREKIQNIKKRKNSTSSGVAYTKLVIVIDNVDRCNEDVAYNLLTDIKTFLGHENSNVIFIIPVDDEALRSHLFKTGDNGNSDISQRKIEEFLRKFFNLVIRIKPYQADDLYSFAQSLNVHNELNFKNATISLVSQEYSRNPRRIIQMLNNLTAELNHYEEPFATKNEGLICAILIIREEFPELYKEILARPAILTNWEIEQLPENIKNAPEGKTFLRISKNYIRTANQDDLYQILTNSKNLFKTLSIELITAIETYDYQKVLSFCSGDIDNVFTYILFNANKQKKNDLIAPLASTFELIAQLNLNFTIPEEKNRRCNALLFDKYVEIIRTTKEYKTLFQFALKLEKQSSLDLKNAIVNVMVTSSSEASYWQPLFNSTLEYFRDETTCHTIQPIFALNFQRLEAGINLNETQWQLLFTNELLATIIKSVKFNENDNSRFDLIEAILKNKVNLAEEFIVMLLMQISNQIPVAPLNNKTKARIIKLTNPVIELLLAQNRSLLPIENVKLIYSKIFASQDGKITLLAEAKTDKDQNLHKYIKFLKNLFRLSNCSIDISATLIEIRTDPKEVLSFFTENAENPNSTTLLSNFIGNLQHIDMLNANLLYEILSAEVNGKALIDNEIAINSLIKFLNKSFVNTKSIIEKFASLLFTSEKTGNQLKEALLSQDLRWKQLPPLLLTKMIDSFSNDTYENYSLSFNLLKLMIPSVSDDKISLILKILNRHLLNDKYVFETIELYKQIRIPGVQDAVNSKKAIENYLLKNNDYMDEGSKESLQNLVAAFSSLR
jgi:hypothetical protein